MILDIYLSAANAEWRRSSSVGIQILLFPSFFPFFLPPFPIYVCGRNSFSAVEYCTVLRSFFSFSFFVWRNHRVRTCNPAKRNWCLQMQGLVLLLSCAPALPRLLRAGLSRRAGIKVYFLLPYVRRESPNVTLPKGIVEKGTCLSLSLFSATSVIKRPPERKGKEKKKKKNTAGV